VIIVQNHRTGYPLLDTQQKQKEQKVKTKNKKKKRSNDPTLRLLLFFAAASFGYCHLVRTAAWGQYPTVKEFSDEINMGMS